MGGHAGLVVGGAASVEPVATTLGLERIRRPVRRIAGGLDVHVRVEANRRLARIDVEVRDHRGLTAGPDDLHPITVEFLQMVCDPFGDRLHVGGMLGLRANRRNSHQLHEILGH
ncbi:hypothetical protein SDC9_98893 [bioreactor metagenome]|uniref:Uncharacterized protein n=1 Tax=bioreactor metagenome TaxID=1076179 RepID=A0A645AGI9_9ZZZZ